MEKHGISQKKWQRNAKDGGWPQGSDGKAIELLENIKSPKYGKQIKDAIQLIASAKRWYDSTVLREPPVESGKL